VPVLSCSKLEEFRVAEAIHCPSCSTRYQLRRERLRPSFRRARCFTCSSEFPVGEEVQRLLAEPTTQPLEEQVALPTDFLADLDATSLDLPTPAFAAPTAAPPLTLGDLEDADEEILEKTLIDIPAFLPEAKDAPPPAAELAAPPVVTASLPPEDEEVTQSGYSSARDAISKLFADAPAPAALKVNQDSSAMDMEATLSALEATLGAAPNPPLSPAQEDMPTASGRLPDVETASSTTLRLSQADLLAALAQTPSPSSAAEPTVALRASDFAPTAGPQDAGAELLRLKIGEEVYAGLTMAQLIGWVEEGRILETHFVARQHSENWLEAQKVPGLRPVFDRLRRERSGSTPVLEPPPSEIAPKKSLFGGLFSKS
jgi:predicted Zn finger-like uncharacterized protein